jgi:glucose/arabinose dehydrogenase
MIGVFSLRLGQTFPSLFIAALALLFAGADFFQLQGQSTAAKPARFIRDPGDQPFRAAPMAESSRSIAISVRTNLHLAFDAHLLRFHTAWEGPGLNLYGPPYSGDKTPYLATVPGEVLWTLPPLFPWSAETQAEDVATLPPGTKFNGISTKAGKTSLLYQITLSGETIQVLETPEAEPFEDQFILRREIQIGSRGQSLFLLAQAAFHRAEEPFAGGKAIVLQREKDLLLLVTRGNATWQALGKNVDYEVALNLDTSADPQVLRKRVQGPLPRAYLHIPAQPNESVVQILSVSCADKQQAMRVAEALLSSNPKTPISNPSSEGGAAESKAADRGRREFSADPKFPRLKTADDFYFIEHFPVPKEIDLLVGGMDWLPNGDLAVCTWPGEVYIIRNAQGPAGKATYQRFARGLHEPLGLKVINGDIFVAQKSELTRLVDTDGDGEADLYETINAGWGYTGNYHAYAFGPELDRDGNFFVFLCGQRARWDVPFAGWSVKISPDGLRTEGFSSGLRVPNGVGTFGPDLDLFITDNQGNWVGACKLNHIQPGRFYGFPSGYPAPAEHYKNPPGFAPPAVWFPRNLSPSTSGFTTIEDDRFGPFRGQMIVGDFQNSVLMRVALEKVNGEWQGAVWPFAKGFLGAVNRLSMGPDGKLYVGGCKRTWSTGSPMEYSLERVVFTGRTPFEIQNAAATSDGFELIFTEAVERESALDPENYFVSQFTYKYHAAYGSPEIDHDGKENSATEIAVTGVTVSEDCRRVRLTLDGLRPGYVTQIRALDVESESGAELRHPVLYYTLNQIP